MTASDVTAAAYLLALHTCAKYYNNHLKKKYDCNTNLVRAMDIRTFLTKKLPDNLEEIIRGRYILWLCIITYIYHVKYW